VYVFDRIANSPGEMRVPRSMALPSKLARVYLGGVNLDDGPVLGIAPVADVGRRKDDMTYKAALRGGPVSHNVLVEGAELLHPLSRLVQRGLGVLTLLVRIQVVLPRKRLNTSPIILGENFLASDLDLDRFERN